MQTKWKQICVLIQLNSLLFLLLMCHSSNLYYLRNNNYNNNYSFVTLICLLHFCKPHLFFILHTPEMFKHAPSPKTNWITTESLADLSRLFMYFMYRLREKLSGVNSIQIKTVYVLNRYKIVESLVSSQRNCLLLIVKLL